MWLLLSAINRKVYEWWPPRLERSFKVSFQTLGLDLGCLHGCLFFFFFPKKSYNVSIRECILEFLQSVN